MGQEPADWSGSVAFREPLQLFAVAAEALARYKLRTLLSILGIILGVAAVIAMMSVSEGARLEALIQVEMLGLNNLVVRNRAPTAANGAATGLTIRDARRLERLVPDTIAVGPLLERNVAAAYQGLESPTRVVGVTTAYQTILNLSPSRGRLLSGGDDRTGARVCVLGARLARTLFGFTDPVGQFVQLGQDYFQVVGVLVDSASQERTPGTLAWRDLGTAALAPLAAVSGLNTDLVPDQHVDEIWLRIGGRDLVEAAGGVLVATMTQLHAQRQDFDVVVPRELLAQRFRTQRTFAVVVGSIAAIALLVGGIGIMNIMLTSVVERTHEIGVRRTVGATRLDIGLQFLVESLLMTVTGGTVGVLVGVVSAIAITMYAGWSTHISVLSVVLAAMVSTSVGLGFGIYPAVKAATLEPVDALRYE